MNSIFLCFSPLVWIFMGVFVMALLDTEEMVFLEWIKSAPCRQIVVPLLFLFWPVLAWLMIKYRIDMSKK